MMLNKYIFFLVLCVLGLVGCKSTVEYVILNPGENYKNVSEDKQVVVGETEFHSILLDLS